MAAFQAFETHQIYVYTSTSRPILEKAVASYITVKLCCSTSIVFDIIVDQLLIRFDLSLANERNKVIIETYVLPILQLVWKIPQYLNVIDNEESQVDHSR